MPDLKLCIMQIDRPAAGLTFRQHIEGLAAFRREYTGRLWIEVMLLGGINDSDEALHDLAAVLKEINPDMVHIVLPTRPAPEQEIRLPSEERIERAIAILSEVTTVVHPLKGNMDLRSAPDLLEAVIGHRFPPPGAAARTAESHCRLFSQRK